MHFLYNTNQIENSQLNDRKRGVMKKFLPNNEVAFIRITRTRASVLAPNTKSRFFIPPKRIDHLWRPAGAAAADGPIYEPIEHKTLSR